jgi:hypothetical protein
MNGFTNCVRFLKDEALLGDALLCELLWNALPVEVLDCEVLGSEVSLGGKTVFWLDSKYTPKIKARTMTASRAPARRPTLRDNLPKATRSCYIILGG